MALVQNNACIVVVRSRRYSCQLGRSLTTPLLLDYLEQSSTQPSRAKSEAGCSSCDILVAGDQPNKEGCPGVDHESC